MKVLFTPLTGSSIAHIIRCFSVADELRKTGHEVYFTSCEKKADFILKQGYEVVGTYETVNLNDPEDQSINYFAENRKKFQGWFNAEIQAAKEVCPDIVVSAPGFLGPHVYYATKIPVVSIMDSPYLSESKGLMGISLSNDVLYSRIVRSIMRPIFNSNFTLKYLREVLKIYNELGINPGRIMSREDLYEPMAVIIPSDSLLEPLREPRKNTKHVGPIFWSGFRDIETDITELFLRTFKGKMKLVYLTFGGSVFDINIYIKMIESVLSTGNRAIVSVGPNFTRRDFPCDTEHILIRKFVPGLMVTRIADVVVNTGSQGSVSQALLSGKPQVCVPTGIDQSFYANRVAELGVGKNANKMGLRNCTKRESYQGLRKDVPERIADYTNYVLANKRFAYKALKCAEVLKSYPNPAKKAASLICKFYKESCI